MQFKMHWNNFDKFDSQTRVAEVNAYANRERKSWKFRSFFALAEQNFNEKLHDQNQHTPSMPVHFKWKRSKWNQNENMFVWKRTKNAVTIALQNFCDNMLKWLTVQIIIMVLHCDCTFVAWKGLCACVRVCTLTAFQYLDGHTIRRRRV